MSGKTVDIEIDEVSQATDYAILVTLSESGRKVWIPRSVIVDELSDVQSDASEGDTGAITIWADFAEKEGIE